MAHPHLQPWRVSSGVDPSATVRPRYSPREASKALQRVLESPSLVILCPGEEFPKLLAETALEAAAVGDLVLDAQVVAFCREREVNVLLTEDWDFDRFRSLKPGCLDEA